MPYKSGPVKDAILALLADGKARTAHQIHEELKPGRDPSRTGLECTLNAVSIQLTVLSPDRLDRTRAGNEMRGRYQYTLRAKAHE